MQLRAARPFLIVSLRCAGLTDDQLITYAFVNAPYAIDDYIKPADKDLPAGRRSPRRRADPGPAFVAAVNRSTAMLLA